MAPGRPARVDRLNQLIAGVAARHPRTVSVVPLHAFLDPGGHFTWTIGGKVVRQGDGVHTTLAGGAYLAPRVLPLLAALGPTADANRNCGHDVATAGRSRP